MRCFYIHDYDKTFATIMDLREWVKDKCRELEPDGMQPFSFVDCDYNEGPERIFAEYKVDIIKEERGWFYGSNHPGNTYNRWYAVEITRIFSDDAVIDALEYAMREGFSNADGNISGRCLLDALKKQGFVVSYRNKDEIGGSYELHELD